MGALSPACTTPELIIARLSLARIASGKPFFSSVVMTGGHVASLERLGDRSIDVCSIDNVTWGFFRKFPPGRR
jgi:ABC-type phosphate/phosphonate transport system substrate-binding protein